MVGMEVRYRDEDFLRAVEQPRQLRTLENRFAAIEQIEVAVVGEKSGVCAERGVERAAAAKKTKYFRSLLYRLIPGYSRTGCVVSKCILSKNCVAGSLRCHTSATIARTPMRRSSCAACPTSAAATPRRRNSGRA